MQFLDLTLHTLAENLALDEALLLEAEAGRSGELLRVWEWAKPGVVLGAGCRLAEDVHEAACLAQGVPILRRSSGGGTVLQGAGCLSYSLVLAYDAAAPLREIRPSFAYILEQVREALAGIMAGIERAGTSDLAVAGRKFSGSSQQRKRNYLLHHGTLLYGFDLERVGCYLRLPGRQPEYRRGRDHAAFLMNLPSTVAELKSRLRAGWRAGECLSAWPEQTVGELVRDKYGSAAWIRRR